MSGFHIEDDHEISGAFQKMAGSTPNLNGVDDKNVFKRVGRVTVYDMIRYTPVNIRRNRMKGCRVYFYNSEYLKRQGKRGLRLFAYKTGCSKSTYLTTIGFVDYTKNLQSTVWVSCQCDHFKYTYEYAMTQRGASDNIYAWQQPPVEKNPHMLPGCCKHILAILDDSLRRTRQFAKLDKNRDDEPEDTDIDGIPEETTPPKGPKNNINKLPNQRDESPGDTPQTGPKSPVPQVYRRQPAPESQPNQMRKLPGGQDEEKTSAGE
jgi:hypothetical protein